MGKGALTATGESFERKTATHGMPLGEAGASFEKSIENLGGNPENPFVIFPEVDDFYKKVLECKKKAAAEKKAEEKKWRTGKSCTWLQNLIIF